MAAAPWIPPDWVPIEPSSNSRCQHCSNSCGGVYRQPPLVNELATNPGDSDLVIEADQVRFDILNNQAELKGEVRVTQGRRQLSGDLSHIDYKHQTASLEGKVVLREPGLLVKGERLHIDVDKTATMEQADLLIHEHQIIGHGSRITYYENGNLTLKDATYSRCAPGSQAWELVASEVLINQDKGYAKARNMRLKLAGVPLLYLPLIYFPIDDKRQSGLLYPSINFDNDNGLSYSQPIYWNIASHFDVTVSPKWIQERGVGWDLETRWLTDNSLSQLNGSYLMDDKGGHQSQEFSGEDRWLLNAVHQGQWGNVSTEILYIKVSDAAYLDDFDSGYFESGIDDTSESVPQTMGIRYQGGHWDLGLAWNQYQRVNSEGDEFYRQLPLITANASYGLAPGLSLEIQQQFANFDHQDEGLVTGKRQRFDYHLNYRRDWAWGYMQQGLGIKNLWYQLEQYSTALDNSQVHIPVASFDSGFFFERSIGGQWEYSVEPRLRLLYSGFRDQEQLPEFDTDLADFSYQQLFQDDRYIGSDRIGDANQVTLGITARAVDTKRGEDLFRLALGQSFYLKDREVTYGLTTEQLQSQRSDVAIQLEAALGRHWNLVTHNQWQPSRGRLGVGNLQLKYRLQTDHKQWLFNASYTYEKLSDEPSIRQGNLSMYMPAGNRWEGFGHWSYDFENKRDLNASIGLRYRSCCWSLAMIWYQNTDLYNLNTAFDESYQRGILLKFELTGLGSVGRGIEGILMQTIDGYEGQH